MHVPSLLHQREQRWERSLTREEFQHRSSTRTDEGVRVKRVLVAHMKVESIPSPDYGRGSALGCFDKSLSHALRRMREAIVLVDSQRTVPYDGPGALYDFRVPPDLQVIAG